MGELVADGGGVGEGEKVVGALRHKRDPAGDQEASECCSSAYGMVIE